MIIMLPIKLFLILLANAEPVLVFIVMRCFAKNEQGFFKYQIEHLERDTVKQKS